jgi:hypothetical protein
VLEKKHALPGAQRGMSVDDRNDLAGPGESHAQMTGTVVRTLVGMDEKGEGLGDEMVEKCMKIGSRFRIGVFDDDEARAGVLYEDGELTRANSAVGDEGSQFPRDFIGALAACFDRDLAAVDFEVHGAGGRR